MKLPEVSARIAVVVGCTVLGWSAVVSGTAAAGTAGAGTTPGAGAFREVPSPDARGTADAIASVSCVAGGDCEAVGSFVPRSDAAEVLAERYDGSTWSLQPLPVPGTAAASSLTGVSCTGASDCEAVGSYRTSSGADEPFAEVWDGSTWSLQGIAVAFSAVSTSLSAVSCTAASDCEAVGSYEQASGGAEPVAEEWDGSTWHAVAVPSGSEDPSLTAVSCTGPSDCEAVGATAAGDLADDPVTTAYHWNGAAWSHQTTPSPVGAAASALAAVSCVIGGTCEAVGEEVTGSGDHATLAEGFDGSTWTVQATPTPTGATGRSLAGVSCNAAGSCEAVGSAGSGDQTTVAERWDGSTWAQQATPTPGGATSSSLVAVSCTADPCEAVGQRVDAAGDEPALAEVLAGSVWTLQVTPDRTGIEASSLVAVSCAVATSCEAVGERSTETGGELVLVERWDGSTWSLQPFPEAAGTLQSTLSGVSCATADRCEAVGEQEGASGVREPLTAALDGAGWTPQPTPVPGSEGGVLTGVSCTLTTRCEAIGSYAMGETDSAPFADVLRGSTWSLQPVPDPPGDLDTFTTGISCTSDEQCEAIGFEYDDVEVPFAEGWDGSTWSLQAVTVPKSTTGTYFGSVSCATRTDCEAVGFVEGGNASAALAERWDGSTWSEQTFPDTPNGSTQVPLGVSCTTSRDCEAVGYSGGDTVADMWDGSTWSSQPTPHPRSATSRSLDAVSCTPGAGCQAVGSNGQRTLVLAGV